jgi:hypothetical protein
VRQSCIGSRTAGFVCSHLDLGAIAGLGVLVLVIKEERLCTPGWSPGWVENHTVWIEGGYCVVNAMAELSSRE